jgi:hypothetical protein
MMGRCIFDPGVAPPAGTVLAVEAKYVEFFLGNENVAVVKKSPIVVTTALGPGREDWYRSPFLLRGGVKLFPADEVIEDGNRVYHATLLRRLKYGFVALIDRSGEVRERIIDERGRLLAKPEKYYVWGKEDKRELVAGGYLTFKIDGGEAKLATAEDPTHVFFALHHEVNSRRHGASIKVYPSSLVTCWGGTGTRTASASFKIVFAPYKSEFTVCYNDPPYRDEHEELYYCYKVHATLPPKKELLAKTPIPDTMFTSANPNTP